MDDSRRVGLLLVFLAATGYALLPVIGRSIYITSDLQPTDVAFWRFFFATPVIWLTITLRRSKKAKSDVKIPSIRLMSAGILYAGATLSAFFALERVSASVYVVLFFTYPALVAVIAMLRGERLAPKAWVALLMTLIGVALTAPDFTNPANTDWLGVLIVLSNALFVALYFHYVSGIMRPLSDTVLATGWVITGTLLVVCLAVPIFGVRAPDNTETWLSLLAMGTLATAGPIYAINVGIRLIGAPQAAIISTVEPTEAMILAMLFLGEVILPVQWLGAAFVVSAVVLLEWRPLRRRKQLRRK